MRTDRPSSFVPALEGMRGQAALGVLLTHVAFQTGATDIPVLGRLLGRCDLAVAIFFALSGFLLWRKPAADARSPRSGFGTGAYLRHRAARILPAYWATVCLVLTLLPGTAASRTVWWANLALLQVFVPLTLTQGLTQMWSLSVEVSFYLLVPLLAAGRPRRRIATLLTCTVCCLGWAFVPVSMPAGIHATNWLPGYLPWFAAGMLLAELDVDPPPWFRRLARRRRLLGAVAVGAFLLACTDLAGPVGLGTLEPGQYAMKVLLGAVLAFALLAPLLVGEHPILGSPLALTVGRWSYGIFLWHVAVLAIVFPVFGILPFHGDFVLVLVLTVALTVPLAAASYALVETPARHWAHRRRPARRDAFAD